MWYRVKVKTPLHPDGVLEVLVNVKPTILLGLMPNKIVFSKKSQQTVILFAINQKLPMKITLTITCSLVVNKQLQ